MAVDRRLIACFFQYFFLVAGNVLSYLSYIYCRVPPTRGLQDTVAWGHEWGARWLKPPTWWVTKMPNRVYHSWTFGYAGPGLPQIQPFATTSCELTLHIRFKKKTQLHNINFNDILNVLYNSKANGGRQKYVYHLSSLSDYIKPYMRA